MIQKRAKPPTTQRAFANGWAELDYLCRKVRYWLYARKLRPNAERYLDRLESVLRAVPKNDDAIIRQEALALVCELNGKLAESIAHRRREIGLMERLHKDARSPKYEQSTRDYMLRDRDVPELEKRRDILKALVQARQKQ